MTVARHDCWAALARPDAPDGLGRLGADALAEFAARLAELISPALAQHFLAKAESDTGRALIDPEAVRRSRLANRFRRHAQIRCARRIAAAGIEAVYIKGFAHAHTLYPDPETRVIGDLDILLRAADVDRLIALLEDDGFHFRASRPQVWGFISEASFLPFVSADGSCELDLHIHPDCYPVYRSLTTERVFAEAVEARAGDLAIRVPRREHMFLLTASNAAKDKFGPFAARKIVDGLAMLRDWRGMLDWPEITEIAAAGRFRKPLAVFCGLLGRLGLAEEDLRGAPPLVLPGPAAAEFSRLVAASLALYPDDPGMFALWRRELLLCTEASVGAYNAWARLKGLVSPGVGIPRPGRDRYRGTAPSSAGVDRHRRGSARVNLI